MLVNVGGRWIALLASAAFHGAIAVAVGGHGASPAAPAASGIQTIDIVVDEPAKVPVEEEHEPAPNTPASGGRAASAPTHHHDYPVAPDHDATPHDPSLVHAPLAPAAPATEEPPVAEAPPAAPPRFTITLSSSGARAVTAAPASDHDHDHDHEHGVGSGSGGAGPGGDGTGEVVAESAVSRPARLVLGPAPAYPPAARAAEVEAEVPLVIVVDRAGSVIDARVAEHAGFGLDEAAVAAVRRYRFSPAERAGRAVAVRMKWSMQFRLR